MGHDVHHAMHWCYDVDNPMLLDVGHARNWHCDMLHASLGDLVPIEVYVATWLLLAVADLVVVGIMRVQVDPSSPQSCESGLAALR